MVTSIYRKVKKRLDREKKIKACMQDNFDNFQLKKLLRRTNLICIPFLSRTCGGIVSLRKTHMRRIT